MDLFRRIFYPIEALVYFVLMVLAGTTICGATHYWDITQAQTITIATASGIVGIFAPVLVEKLFKIKFSHLIDILIAVDLFAAIILGEALTFYYYFPGMDKIFHFCATAELALGGYVLAKYFLGKTNKGKHHVLFALIFAFFFAIAFQAFWELYEFTFDQIAGTNMQKYIPSEFYDRIDADGVLQLSQEEIAAFFSQFGGYHFALEDTMYDIVADCLGALTGCVGCAVLFHFYLHLQNHIIYRPETEAVLEEGEENTLNHKRQN